MAAFLIRAASLAFCAAVGAAPATAQDPTGIGIAHAGGMAFSACTGATPERALACARRQCQENGSRCARVRWCYPSGYSGAMSYLNDGIVTEVTFACGATSVDGLRRMLAGRCAGDETATECRLVALWDPAGTESQRRDLLGKNTAD